MGLFRANRHRDEVIIEGNRIIFKTMDCRIEKSIGDVVRVEEEIVYGGLLYLIFGPRVSEKPGYSNAGYKSISMRFFFKNDDYIGISLSVGDDFMVERSLKTIRKVIKELKAKKADIQVERVSDFKYI